MRLRVNRRNTQYAFRSYCLSVCQLNTVIVVKFLCIILASFIGVSVFSSHIRTFIKKQCLLLRSSVALFCNANAVMRWTDQNCITRQSTSSLSKWQTLASLCNFERSNAHFHVTNQALSVSWKTVGFWKWIHAFEINLLKQCYQICSSLVAIKCVTGNGKFSVWLRC